MRFCDAAAGHIYMDGKDYHSMKPEELRKHIAMVPQQVNLFSGTIRENLLLADPDADDQTLMEAVKEAGLLKFVQSLEKGLNSDVGNAGASLSGGQRQKIGIARALLSKAEYMIFDEATSSVDPESEKEIWETIGHLAHTRTLIIISHRMSSVRGADCIYVLKDGRVAQQGDHETLMAQDGLYHELVYASRQWRWQNETKIQLFNEENEPPASGHWKTDPELYCHFNSCQCTGSTLPYGTDGIWRFMAFGCGWFL